MTDAKIDDNFVEKATSNTTQMLEYNVDYFIENPKRTITIKIPDSEKLLNRQLQNIVSLNYSKLFRGELRFYEEEERYLNDLSYLASGARPDGVLPLSVYCTEPQAVLADKETWYLNDEQVAKSLDKKIRKVFSIVHEFLNDNDR